MYYGITQVGTCMYNLTSICSLPPTQVTPYTTVITVCFTTCAIVEITAMLAYTFVTIIFMGYGTAREFNVYNIIIHALVWQVRLVPHHINSTVCMRWKV